MKKPRAKAEKAVEKAENKLAKSLPAPKRKQFTKIQAREKKLPKGY